MVKQTGDGSGEFPPFIQGERTVEFRKNFRNTVCQLAIRQSSLIQWGRISKSSFDALKGVPHVQCVAANPTARCRALPNVDVSGIDGLHDVFIIQGGRLNCFTIHHQIKFTVGLVGEKPLVLRKFHHVFCENPTLHRRISMAILADQNISNGCSTLQREGKARYGMDFEVFCIQRFIRHDE
jgi:hypothetical protein